MDETFAATGVVYEEIIAVNLDHHDIFRLVPKDKMFARIRALLKNVSSRKLSQSTLVGNTGMLPCSYFISEHILTARLI